IEQFLAACDPFEHVLFEFFWMSGFRDGEVQHVTRADIDLKEQVVKVTEKPRWGFIPKDWEQREVPIPDRLVEPMKRQLDRKDLKSTMRYLKPARGSGIRDKVNNTFKRPRPVLVRTGS